VFLGFGPHLLLPGSLSMTMKTSTTRLPMNGTKQTRYHQPLLPESCRRRTLIPREGRTTNTL
jgi:hypothetical protein